jgi:hypothetical protein
MEIVMKKLSVYIWPGLLLLISLPLFLLSSCTPHRPPDAKLPPAVKRIVNIDSSTFAREVTNYHGYVIVTFYNDNYWQSKEMLDNIEGLFERYRGKIKFCNFFWDVNESGDMYGLELLPTVVLYKNGREIDRIKGLPDSAGDRAELPDDMDLWILKNVLNARGNEYAGTYRYRFNNSATLNISNY